MFRAMRRKKQALDEQGCLDVLRRGEWGVLGLLGDDGYPYTVPLNYVFCDGRLYFHCAREGHKMDALMSCDKASFCVVDKSDLLPSKITTLFRSVIVFGRLRVIDDQETRVRSLTALTKALSEGESEESRLAEIERCWRLGNVEMLELVPEHISGKQAKELMKGSLE